MLQPRLTSTASLQGKIHLERDRAALLKRGHVLKENCRDPDDPTDEVAAMEMYRAERSQNEKLQVRAVSGQGGWFSGSRAARSGQPTPRLPRVAAGAQAESLSPQGGCQEDV